MFEQTCLDRHVWTHVFVHTVGEVITDRYMLSLCFYYEKLISKCSYRLLILSAVKVLIFSAVKVLVLSAVKVLILSAVKVLTI